MITRDYLLKEIESLRAQQANALAVAQQAIGAITLAESLLARLDEPEMTETDLAEAIARGREQ